MTVNKKLEIGPSNPQRSVDGTSKATWDTLDSNYSPTFRCQWGAERLPISNDTYDWVHASHVLEHVPWWQTRFSLSEVLRILKPGGRFTVWVPDTIAIINKAEQDPEGFMQLEKSWTGLRRTRQKRDPWLHMNARVLWGYREREEGQIQHFHKAIFSRKSLKALLQDGGFNSVTALSRDVSIDPGHGWMEMGFECFK